MSTEEIISKMDSITKKTEEFYMKNFELCNIPMSIHLNPETRNHVIGIAASIAFTKLEIVNGGSFVTSIVKNDLMGTFGNADHINAQCIKFYATYLYNFPFHEFL